MHSPSASCIDRRLLLPAAVPRLHAAKVKVWHQHAPADYDKAAAQAGRRQQRGRAAAVAPARSRWPASTPRTSGTWSRTRTATSSWPPATRARSSRSRPTARSASLTPSRTARSCAWPWRPTASVYAGTGPSGQIVRIGPDGKAKVFCETGDSYVWALAVDPQAQTLYAGTGPKGRIYQIDADGKASVLLHDQAGTHPVPGLRPRTARSTPAPTRAAWSIASTPRARASCFTRPPRPEVRAACCAADGVYAGTSAAGRKRVAAGGTAMPSPWSPPRPGRPSRDLVSRRREDGEPASDWPQQVGRQGLRSGQGHSHAGPARSDRSARTRSTASAPTARPRAVPREEADAQPAAAGGKLFVGTGMEGQLFEIDEASHERTRDCPARSRPGPLPPAAARTARSCSAPATPASSMSCRTATPPAARSSPKCWTPRSSASGAHSAGRPTLPAGTRVSVAVRSGNVAEPDDTWSDWSAEQTDRQTGDHRRAAGPLPAIPRHADDDPMPP